MSLLKKTKTTTRADKIEAFQSTTCDFGTPLPIAYGTCKLSPNVINFQDFTSEEIKNTTKSGKAKSTNITYEYNVYLELALAEGIIDGIGRIWVGDDAFSNLSSFNSKGNNVGSPLALNVGDNADPTTYMATKHPDIAVGYKDMAYLHGFVYLGDQGSVPSYSFEVKGLCREDGVDSNPADVIKDLLKRIGCDRLDQASFENYRNYCSAADLLVSTPSDVFTNQSKCQEIVKTLLDLTNAYMFYSGTEGFKIVPRDDRDWGEWKADRTIRYNITEDDMEEGGDGVCVSFSRKDSSELYNRFGVAFTNRENDYTSETVFYEDSNDIIKHGVKSASTIEGKWFHTLERALKVANIQARKTQTESVKYNFKVGWNFVDLEPGDLITITDGSIGLDHQKAMVDSITEDENGLISVTAIRREEESVPAVYSIPKINYNQIDFNVPPEDVDNVLVIVPPSQLITASSGLEVWLAIHGISRNWGGCNVYLSTYDGGYKLHGTQSASSNYGKIISVMSNTSTEVDVEFTNPKTVEMLIPDEGEAVDIYVDGEFMSYTNATLIGINRYHLQGIKRGLYDTNVSAHGIDSNFAVIDGDLYTIQLTSNYLGRELFMKFPSFNSLQKNVQELNDVDFYTHNVVIYDIPNVYDVNYKVNSVGSVLSPKYNVVLSWTPPDYNNYASARIYTKSSGNPAWVFKGEGFDNHTIEDIGSGAITIAICTKDNKGNYEVPDDSTQINIMI